MTDKELLDLLPPIPEDAHKYQRGSLLVVGGSRRYFGAPVMTALAAERTGAGYVSLAVPPSIEKSAQAHLLTVPIITASDEEHEDAFAPKALDQFQAQLKHLDAVAYGPGLSAHPNNRQLLKDLLSANNLPLVIDASGLFLLSQLLSDQTAADSSAASKPTPLRPDPEAWWTIILTPHAGELATLLKATGAANASQLAQKLKVTVVSKGPETVISAASKDWASNSGTVGMAKAGSGDVLTGIIAALIAQGAPTEDAARLGVEIHGRSGRLAEQQTSRRSMVARDIIECIPEIMRRVEGI
ncbi:MAG: NAD(P)H-hydrate dehydratase [Coriobacteriales bacterium]|jgi:NAD(P)H-hydrate epimerase|nr:NAD(P)H-hydrate dehydratase [Coriobacteriales bacterium]